MSVVEKWESVDSSQNRPGYVNPKERQTPAFLRMGKIARAGAGEGGGYGWEAEVETLVSDVNVNEVTHHTDTFFPSFSAG